MNAIIRAMTPEDKETVIEMMRTFYTSPAVLSNGSEEIYARDVDNCVGDCPFLEGYVFEASGETIGYAMLAKSFSTEFGKPCIWIEDLYIREAYRNQGIGSRFFAFAEEKYPNVLFMLEVEAENRQAIQAYEKNGYEVFPYMEMKKDSRSV